MDITKKQYILIEPDEALGRELVEHLGNTLDPAQFEVINFRSYDNFANAIKNNPDMHIARMFVELTTQNIDQFAGLNKKFPASAYYKDKDVLELLKKKEYSHLSKRVLSGEQFRENIMNILEKKQGASVLHPKPHPIEPMKKLIIHRMI